jgi:hypothetical protein
MRQTRLAKGSDPFLKAGVGCVPTLQHCPFEFRNQKPVLLQKRCKLFCGQALRVLFNSRFGKHVERIHDGNCAVCQLERTKNMIAWDQLVFLSKSAAYLLYQLTFPFLPALGVLGGSQGVGTLSLGGAA